MKKVILFVLTLACMAGVFVLAKDMALSNVETFKKAFGEVDQWKTLM